MFEIGAKVRLRGRGKLAHVVFPEVAPNKTWVEYEETGRRYLVTSDHLVAESGA